MDEAHILRSKLADLRRLVRLAAAGAGLGRLALRGAALVAASFALDRAFELPHAARLLLLCAGTAALAWWAGRLLLRPLVRPLPDACLALEVEERFPASGDVLASALSFGPAAGGSAVLRAAALGRAELVARSLRPEDLVRWRGARRRLIAGLLALAVLAGAAMVRPADAALWYRRAVLLEDVQWPRATSLSLADFPGLVRYVPRGADVDLRVAAAGVVPRMARLELRDVRTGAVRSLAMSRAGQGEFTAHVPGLDASSAFTVQAGDGRLPEHRLEVVERPAVAGARMRVEPPAYISAQPVDLAWNSDTFQVPAGSRVMVTLEATKPLSAATCRLDGGPPLAMEQAGPSTVSTGFDAARDAACEFALTDTLGIGMAEPLRVQVKAVADAPPAVRLVTSGVGEMLVPSARVPVHVSATDDYGVTAVALERRFEGAQGATDLPPVDLMGGTVGVEYSADRVLELAPLDLAPGGRLVLSARATDNREPVPPNTGISPPLTFRIVTVQELLASLLVRQQDLRRDVEGEIGRERDLSQRLDAAHAVDLARELRTAARVPQLAAAGYRAVLEQMLNNGVVAQPAFDRYVGEIVAPLEGVGAPDGPVQRAAAALDAGAAEEARGQVAEAVGQMDLARSRMMVLESYAGLVASLKEVTASQQSVLNGTQQLQQGILELLGKQ